MSETQNRRVAEAQRRARAFRDSELTKVSNERPAATQTTSEKQPHEDKKRDRSQQTLST